MASREPVGLRVRLALAFVAVAVLAVGLVAVLAVIFTERDIAALVQLRRDDLVSSLATDAVSTYNTGKPGWSDVDLKPALQLAGSDGAQAAVLDNRGQVVTSTLVVPVTSDKVTRHPLTLNGRRIGTLLVRYTGRGLTESAANLRTSLVRAVIGAAVLAAVLALIASVLVSRRITRPVIAVIGSVRAMGRGERNARVGPVTGAPAELRDLAVTFDQMADTLAGQERLRRDLVADVAHELRTPVAVLQANTEALLDDLVPHTRDQTVSLHEEVVRLGRLVGDLQTLAAAEAAALQLNLQPCDLASVAAAAAEDWTASFAAAGIAFSHELTGAPVLADPGLAAPDHQQPAEQRAQVHPARRRGDDAAVHGGRRGQAGGQRHRAGDRSGRAATRVRPPVARRLCRAHHRQRHRPGDRCRARACPPGIGPGDE